MSSIDSVSSVGESPSGTESFSADLGEGPLNISISASAKASANADGSSSAESTPEDQPTKDMEGTQSEYSAQDPEVSEAGETDETDAAGESDAEETIDDPMDSEIEEMKEGLADGLMAIEELEPGFIEDVIAQVDGNIGEGENVTRTADIPQGVDAIQGEDTTQGEDAVEVEDNTQGEDATQGEDTEVSGATGGDEELLASLEELAAGLEQIIGMLSDGGEEKPDEGEDVAVSGKETIRDSDEIGETSDPNAEDVAEGMAEEVGDGQAPEAAQGTQVDTFMEIFDQMSPDAQSEVVGILASGLFGQEGLEAADAVTDDATGKIDTRQVVDQVEA
jgi:hypothetical protein